MSRDALIIGINQYIKNPLKTPAADAEAIAQILKDKGDFDVIRRFPSMMSEGRYAINPHPTIPVKVDDLEQEIIQLFNPEDHRIPEMALLFFAGHGARRNRGGITEGYLALTDTHPDRPSCGLSLEWLRKLLEKSPVPQQIIWLDCCYSGEFIKPEELEEAYPGQGSNVSRCFIAASREYESAYEHREHGILTAALLKGLEPSHYPDEQVDNEKLCEFVKKQLKGSPQEPVSYNSGSKMMLTATATVAEFHQSPLAGICPYKGLQFFDFNEEDPKYFYGRSTLTDELLEKVRTGHFLAVLGVSGSGKSSVVRAGLLHELAKGQKLSGSD